MPFDVGFKTMETFFKYINVLRVPRGTKLLKIGISHEKSFIHSKYFYSAHLQIYTIQRRSRYSTDTVPEFHAEAPQATVSERLAQGPYLAARPGVEPMKLRDERRRLYQSATQSHNGLFSVEMFLKSTNSMLCTIILERSAKTEKNGI